MTHDEMRFYRREVINALLQDGFTSLYAITGLTRSTEENIYGQQMNLQEAE